MRFSFVIILLLLFFNSFAQKQLNVAFYNVENLFDTKKSGKWNDIDFTPNGKMRWTNERMLAKVDKIAFTIKKLNELSPIHIMGLCEVESSFPTSLLLENKHIKNLGLKAVMLPLGDERGISQLVLYNPKGIKPIEVKTLSSKSVRGRSFLYYKSLVGSDTINFFICHLSSRIMGQKASEPLRIAQTKALRFYADSLVRCNAQAKIVVMGDFNDEPIDKSIDTLLVGGVLKTLSKGKNKTHYYSGKWFEFDHIFSNIKTDSYSRVFSPDFLLNEDKKPLRTYQGEFYKGGVSDHLPVFVTFKL